MDKSVLLVSVGEVGGGKTQSRILTRMMVRRGFDVSVLTMGSGRMFCSERMGKVRTYSAGRFKENRRGRLKMLEILKYLTVEMFNPFVFLFTIYLILKNGIKTVIIPTYNQISLAPLVASWLLNRNVIVTMHTHELLCSYSSIMPFCRGVRGGQCGSCMSIHHSLPKNMGWVIGIYNLYTSLAIFLKQKATNVMAGRIIFPSEDSRRFHVRHGVSAGKSGVIPPFNDALTYDAKAMKRISRRIGEPGKKTILFVGRIEIEKGVGVLLRSLKEVSKKNRGWRAVIVGEGKDLDNMEDLSKSLGISKGVRFAGFVPRSELFAYYRLSDIVVIPSLFPETYSIVLTEASLAKKLTISSRIGALAERVIDGENGFLVSPNNPKELAKKISFVLQNFGKMVPIAESAYEDVRTKYDPAASFSKYQGIMEAAA